MSIIKFGKSVRDDSGNLIDRQFGKKADRINYWKFGESSQFYVLNSLFDYLPSFIIKNKLCIDILTSVAITMIRWSNKMKELINYRIRGGLATRKYANSDLQLYINNKKSDDEFISAIHNAYQIHKERGTIKGLLSDIKRFSGDDNASIKYFDWDRVGWNLDITFPELDDDGIHSYYTNVFLDISDMLNINVRNKTEYTDTEFINIIKKEFIPLNKNIRITLPQPHIIVFNDTINGFKIKFGDGCKFGQIIE